MPLTVAAIGEMTAPIDHSIDSRWLMAYASSVEAMAPPYIDTTRPDGIVAHPVFTSAIEWPAVLAMRDRLAAHGLEPHEAARGVHLTHDVVLRRPIHAGDHLHTTATVRSMTARRSGALVELDLVTTDDGGHPVAETVMGTLYRDVAVTGAEPALSTDTTQSVPPTHPSQLGTDPDVQFGIEIPANAAHVYTECSRIWNPIHTDARTAARAGLPGIILHGTATLALALSGLVARLAADDPQRVQGITCRFAAMVGLPSRLTVRAWRPIDDRRIGFVVKGPAGELVLRDGWLDLGERTS